MKEKKHIDRLFQEKLRDFEVTPNPEVWNAIEQQLMKKKERRILPLWIRYGSAAAILLMLVTSGLLYFNETSSINIDENFNNQQIITDTKNEEPSIKIEAPSFDKNEQLIVNINEVKSDLNKSVENSPDNSIVIIEEGNSTELIANSKKDDKTISPKKNKVEELTFNDKKNNSQLANTNDNKLHSDLNKSSVSHNNNSIATIETENSTELIANAVKSDQTNSPKKKETEKLILNDKNDDSQLANTKENKIPNGLNIPTENGKSKGFVLNEDESPKTLITKSNEEEKGFTKKEIVFGVVNENEAIAATNKGMSNRWSIGPIVAPLYFNTISEGSPISEALATNNKNAEPTAAYGIKLNYKLSKKFSLQTGLNSVNLAYTTENVVAAVSSESALLDNPSSLANIEGINAISLSRSDDDSNRELNDNSYGTANFSGELSQTFSYLEIPIEAKYVISPRKLGVNLIGGFSTFILNDNSISLNSSNEKIELGKATNLNKVNFSGNLGVDFDYKITKKIYINVSPMFKYQFNMFSENNGGFKPYYFGLYSGLNFRF